MAIALLAIGPWMMLFPERLADENTDATKQALKNGESKQNVKTDFKTYIKDSLVVFKRLFKVKIYMFNLLALVFFYSGKSHSFNFKLLI